MKLQNQNNNKIELMEITESEQVSAIEKARLVTYKSAFLYWLKIKATTGISWPFRKFQKLNPESLDIDVFELESRVNFLIGLPPREAGYELSQVYVKNLPKSFRAEHGVYYTPIDVVDLMIDEALDSELNLKTANVVDTSCGGSAFLCPLIKYMLRDDLDDSNKIQDLDNRLAGFELDPFAAWLSQFLIDCELATLAPRAQRPKQTVQCIDALSLGSKYFGCYDYVIGNPPYRKLTSSNHLYKDRFEDVMSGAPNLYQLFYKLSFQLVKNRGHVHLITPTGFIGGAYFAKLRKYILRHGSPLSFSFFDKRGSIFDGVLQELVIGLFVKDKLETEIDIYTVNKKRNQRAERESIGSMPQLKYGTDSWALPRSKQQTYVIRLMSENDESLESLGYKVKTGYLVPHKSEQNLSRGYQDGYFKIIWSEAIKDGRLEPQLGFKEDKAKYFFSKEGKGLVDYPAILVKRTSSKEQRKRINLALASHEYLKRHGPYYPENHINIISEFRDPDVELDVIAALLSTRIVDDIFRCRSGTVTVSATELRQIPLPSIPNIRMFAASLSDIGNNQEDIEKAAIRAYGLDETNI